MAPWFPGPLPGPGTQLSDSTGLREHLLRTALAERSEALRSHLDEWLGEQARLLDAWLAHQVGREESSCSIPVREIPAAAPFSTENAGLEVVEAEDELVIQTPVICNDESPSAELDNSPQSQAIGAPFSDGKTNRCSGRKGADEFWNPVLQRHMSSTGSFCPMPEIDTSRPCWSGAPLAKRIDESACFNTVTTVVIILNVGVVAATTQLAASGLRAIKALAQVELLFTLYYMFELLVRLLAHGTTFFNSEAGWRAFDTVLVIVAILEQGLSAIPAVSALRILRVCKVIKVFRLVRTMRSFEELRLILDSLLGSAKTLFWSLVVMIFVMFIFVVFFMQGAAGEDWVEGQQAREPWNTFVSGMCALFEAGTGGMDWKEIADPLYDDGVHFYFGFVVYMAFFLFVLMNSLTGIFVERLLQMVTTDATVMMNKRLKERDVYAKHIQSLFTQADTDGNELLTFDELVNFVNDKRMIQFATSLDIDESDLLCAFNIVTQSGQLSVDLESFVIGCIKLRGNAKSVDLLDVHLMQRRLQQIMQEFQESFREFNAHAIEQFCDLHDKSDKLHDKSDKLHDKIR